MDESGPKRILQWSHAGQGAMVLAVLLVGVGLVLAIRQVQAVPLQRVAALRPEARDLAGRIRTEILVPTKAALEEASRRRSVTSGPAGGVEALSPRAWIRRMFLYEGEGPGQVVWSRGEEPHPAADGDAVPGGETARLTARLQTYFPVISRGEVGFLHENVRGEDVVAAYMVWPTAGRPSVTGALLDTSRLLSEVIEPLVNAHPNLALSLSVLKTETWMEPLGPALPFLSIRPSDAFVEAQQASAFRQTLIYVAIMLLILAALLMVMQGVIRVARREIELSRLKSAFVADVSHELKTPLALIQMFAETLLEGRVRSEEKKQEYYAIITRETQRLTHLINNILDFARIESGKKLYKMQRVRVEAIARDVYEAYRHDLDHEGFEHGLAVAEGLPEVEADPDAIAQVLLNLFSNAIKYSDEEKWLRMELAPETRRGCRGVLISVQDRGIGIRPEDLPHVFDGFYRAADDKVRKRRGAGLGLTLVRDLVEAHGGYVDVEARLVKGTTFHIFLPGCREHREEPTDGQDSDRRR